MKTRITFFLTLCFTVLLQAQELRFALQPVQYATSDGTLYWDMYCTLDASTVSYKKNQDSTWSSSLKVALKVGDKLDVFQFTYTGRDSASGAPLLLQKSTAMSPAGNSVSVSVLLIDEYSEREWQLSDTLEINRSVVLLSEALILDPSLTAPESFLKGSVSVVPKANLGIPVFDNESTLRWYSDVHVITGKYLLKYHITNSEGEIISGSQGYKRCLEGANPVLVDLDLSSKPSGNYEVVLTLFDSIGYEVEAKNAPFLWYNTIADSLERFNPDVLVTKTEFERSWGKWSEIHNYIRMVAPIASLADRRILGNLRDLEDTARVAQFLVGFWQENAPGNAIQTWKGYLDIVQRVDREFGSRTLPGYKTQMGRVFLQYGAPSLVEDRPFDGKNYPYQIWQYDHLKSGSTPVQQNEVFIFVDQELVGRQLTLIHSSAIGEVKDHKWQYHLSRHTNAGPDIDATSSRMGRDNFGERISNSLIIGNQGTWFDTFNN